MSPSARSSPLAATHRHSSQTVPSEAVTVAATRSKPWGTTPPGASVVGAVVDGDVAGEAPVDVVDGDVALAPLDVAVVNRVVVTVAGDVELATVSTDVGTVVVTASSSSPHATSATASTTSAADRIRTTVASAPNAIRSGDAPGRVAQQ